MQKHPEKFHTKNARASQKKASINAPATQNSYRLLFTLLREGNKKKMRSEENHHLLSSGAAKKKKTKTS